MLENHKSELMNGASGTAMPLQAQGEVMPSGPPEPQQPTPEEQQQYQLLVGLALQFIHNEKTEPQIDAMLRHTDTDEGLAEAASLTMHNVLSQAKKRGMELSPDAQAAATRHVFEILASDATEDGIKDYEKDTKSLHGAYYRFQDKLRVQMQEAGMIDQQQAQQDLQRMQEMDEAGRLEEFFRDLDARDKRGSGPEAHPPTRGLGRGAE